MPRPTGAGERDMNERIAKLAERNRREGYTSEVKVRHVKPEPRPRAKRRRAPSVADTGYPGWTPTERECRREGCDVRFVPSMPSQAYHSIECRNEAVRAQRRRTDKGKRERRKVRVEEARGGARTRTCALGGCEVEFEPPFPRSLYCSPEHSQEARLKSRRRSERRLTVSAETSRVIDEIDRLERSLNGRLPELGRDYLVLLWQKVNKDPECPPHVYDRLERLLGLPAADGSTIADDAG